MMELIRGNEYRIRLTNGNWTIGVFLYEKEPFRVYTNRVYTNRTHFMFRNVATDRLIEIKSKARIREIKLIGVTQ